MPSSFGPMKTHMLLHSPILGALLATVSAHAQNPLPNPGFEEWVDGSPAGWTSNNNEFTGQPISPNATGHTGASAGRGTYLGLISAPIINTIDDAGQPLAITQAYQRLTFYYQLQLESTQGSEVFSSGAVFTDANGNTVGQAFRLFDRTANTGTWTYADLPVTYTGTAPVGVNVNFSLNGFDAVVGSYFVVDDVTLDNGTTGVEEMEQDAALGAAWPMPAADEVNVPFSLPQATVVGIDVSDVLGRRVQSMDLGMLPAGRYKQVLDVQGWEAGAYTIVLRTAYGKHAQVLVVRH